MHNLLQRYGKLFSVGLSVVCSVLLVAVVVSAATTIGSNINTDGTLAVTDTATLSSTLSVTGKATLTGGATSTRLSNFLWFGAGGTATTTIDSAGNLSVAGTASVTGLFTPTGGISTSTWDNISLGLVTPNKVSSTLLSVMNTLYVGGTATTTIDSAGNLSVAGTASVTGLTTLGSTSSTALSAYNAIFVGRTATSTIMGGASATSTFSSGIELDEASATSTLHIGHNVDGAATLMGKGSCIALQATSGTPSGISFLYLTVVPKVDGTGLELVTSTNRTACGY